MADPALGDPTEAWKARGRELNALYEAIGAVVRACGLDPSSEQPLHDLHRVEAAVGRLRDEAENAVHAASQVLPVNGSWDGGYRPVEPAMPTTIAAEPSEWFDVADSLCRLHRELLSPSEKSGELRE